MIIAVVFSLLLFVGCETDDPVAQGTPEPSGTSTPDPSGTATPDGVVCVSDDDCTTGGCSGEMCGKKGEIEDVMTTCEVKPEHICFKMTRCACIENSCSWVQTDPFIRCMAEKQAK